ncbi:hypothetical protein AgCh_017173 [Apium graveolens]
MVRATPRGRIGRSLPENGNPLGRRDFGKRVVKWISQGMKAMASDFATAEIQGEFSAVEQKMGHINAITQPPRFKD